VVCSSFSADTSGQDYWWATHWHLQLCRDCLTVAQLLQYCFAIITVSYLEDWLLFSTKLMPVPQILETIRSIGLQINESKSILHPTPSLVYLGLHIETIFQRLQPTQACIRHLIYLISIVPHASQQDLQRIAGYVSWLCFAMSWPAFIASTLWY
jgi:hypothetical protein